jgi:hypothetical protein
MLIASYGKQTRYDLGIDFILDTKQSRFHYFFVVLWMTEADLAYKMVSVSITKNIQCKSHIYHLILHTIQHLWSIKTTVRMNK